MTNYSDLATILKMIENGLEIREQSDLMDFHLSQPSVLHIDMPLSKKKTSCKEEA